MSPTFSQKLGPKTRKTNIKAKIIKTTTLKTYKIVISTFFLLDKYGRARFLEKTFLSANFSPNVVFRIFFLTMSNIDINF